MSSFFREFGQQTQIRDIRRQRPRPAKTYLAGPGASQSGSARPRLRWRADSVRRLPGLVTSSKYGACLPRFAFLISLEWRNVYISDKRSEFSLKMFILPNILMFNLIFFLRVLEIYVSSLEQIFKCTMLRRTFPDLIFSRSVCSVS